MNPNTNPTPARGTGSGNDGTREPTRDPLPLLADEIKHAYTDSQAAAIETGRALLRARRLLRGHGDWVAWLGDTCHLTTKVAKPYMKLAGEDAKGRKTAAPPPRVDATVVCGWCLHARAEQDLPPKHISGPRGSEDVHYGECDRCREAMDSTLRKLRNADHLPLDAKEEDLDAFRAVEWSLAHAKLRAAFHHTNEALQATRSLQELENLGLKPGIRESIDELVRIQKELTKLTCELLLLSEGSHFDAALFEPDLQDLDPEEARDGEESEA